ncbi:restriction endonuclease [Streptomyces sp. ASQP_92]|uniref:restriction endonuclease n=1 Tax=Streptomyces sp. ASQP_92 TaxID=2979116 RepID=UPI0021C1975E|nr:restriction endonuclease [Streptomyces sp. ASQP_92]MCT9091720.1 restriction endonuclease [Streptomyces sp. ASQP_92]
MDSFELGRLTDHDFEVVCHDLFSDVLGIPLEIFPRGRDRGIDLRHTGCAGTTVVQCKHWPRATQKTLIRRLIKDELPKVRALAPDRYIVATTVGLTVDGKEESSATPSPRTYAAPATCTAWTRSSPSCCAARTWSDDTSGSG